MAQFHIGDIVRIDGTKIKAPITHISHGSGEGDTIRYKVEGRYWSENSVSLIKAAPAKDSARKAPARLHRALDRVMDARGKAKDAVEGPYDVGYYDKATGIMYSRDVVITAGSWDEAMRKAKAGARPGEELYRVSPREKNAVWAKDRVPQDCLDLGTLPV